jgi:nucleotide-binding universal stress UspA family protein
MIKDIVVNLSVGGHSDAGENYAISLAQAFEANLTGVAFAYEPTPPMTVFGSIPVDLAALQRAESEKAAKAVAARFEEKVVRAGVSGDSRVIDASLMGAADAFGRMARRYDLAVLTQPDRDQGGPEEPLAHAALFETGRPALIVPYVHKAAFSVNQVLVGWDGSRSAARAIGDAMPFLIRAKAVDVVIVAAERSNEREIAGSDIAQHLARHSVKVDVKRMVATDVEVANIILSYAADSSADMIVMGGYGHSRLREFILGGATRGILEAMTVPTLMSH